MKTSLSAVMVAATLALGSMGAARAADYAFSTNASGDGVITVTGPITPLDGGVFLLLVEKNRPRIVEIEGPGGDLLSAIRMGVIVHENRMSTHAIGECRSACAYVWIAGLRMLADDGVEIVNHLPVAYGRDVDGVPTQEVVALFGWYLGRLSISVEMMTAFLDAATQGGTTMNADFDMLAFAQYWNAPVEIVTDGTPILARSD